MILEYLKVSCQAHRNSIFKNAAQSRKRYCVYKGGAGSGKSSEVAIKLIKKLSNPKYKGSNLLCVRKVEATNRDSTLAELKKAIKSIFGEHANKVWQVPESRTSTMYCRCLVTGAEIIFRGCNNADDIEKIKSVNFEKGKLTDIWIEEATEITEQDFEILDDRLRGILPEGLFYQANLTFNPVSATSWLKKRFFDFKDEEAEISESTYLDNRFIDPDYHKRMQKRKTLDPEGYKVYALGEWGSLGGIIFKNFVVEEFDKNQFYTRYYGMDFGFNHPTALLDICFKDGDIYVCRELYEREKDMGEIIQQMNEERWLKNVILWCDSAEPDRIKMLQKAGYEAFGVSKGGSEGSVKAQIDWLKGIISKDKVVKRTIHIHPDCKNLIHEIQNYRWQLDPKSNTYLDKPVQFEDDAIAALRYGIERLRQPEHRYGF